MTKKTGFEELIERAAAAIKNRRKAINIHLNVLGRDFEFNALSTFEMRDIAESCGDNNELYLNRIIYRSCPELAKIANELEQRGVIQTGSDVVDILYDTDKLKIMDVLGELSGRGASEIVIRADEIKNA